VPREARNAGRVAAAVTKALFTLIENTSLKARSNWVAEMFSRRR
jgi:hypothetical protein